jgi:serine protease Do
MHRQHGLDFAPAIPHLRSHHARKAQPIQATGGGLLDVFEKVKVLTGYHRLYLPALLAGLLLAGCGAAPDTAAPPPAPAVRSALPLGSGQQTGFVGLVRAVAPAVVNISSLQIQGAGLLDAMPQFLQESPLSRWLRKELGADDDSQAVLSKSLGSGFILTPDGYILTNRHVVANGNRILVKLANGQEYRARIIGSDRLTDVSLLKIPATGLPVLQIGNPKTLRVGDWVVAIGAPFGFDRSVTAGIVSALGRSLPQEEYVPFIQSDVAVNPGNSGGPLFNMSGQVVGINSQIYSESGGWMGVSFAIPIDVALNVAHQLNDHGKVLRGRIGVVVQDVTPRLARALGLAKPAGALVAKVQKHGAAAAAGIQAGDVITAFNGTPIVNADELPRAVAAVPPGTRVPVSIWRKRAPMNLQLEIGG